VSNLIDQTGLSTRITSVNYSVGGANDKFEISQLGTYYFWRGSF